MEIQKSDSVLSNASSASSSTSEMSEDEEEEEEEDEKEAEIRSSRQKNFGAIWYDEKGRPTLSNICLMVKGSKTHLEIPLGSKIKPKLSG